MSNHTIWRFTSNNFSQNLLVGPSFLKRCSIICTHISYFILFLIVFSFRFCKEPVANVSPNLHLSFQSRHFIFMSICIGNIIYIEELILQYIYLVHHLEMSKIVGVVLPTYIVKMLLTFYLSLVIYFLKLKYAGNPP